VAKYWPGKHGPDKRWPEVVTPMGRSLRKKTG
jgi:hypothetical protein